MLRKMLSLLTLVVATANAMAMPLHLAIGHGHEGHALYRLPEGYAHLHTECETDHHDCVTEENAPAASESMGCAQFCCAPHRHDAHHHGADEPGFATLRDRNAPDALLAYVPASPLHAAVVAAAPTPPSPHRLSTLHEALPPPLRGPPAL
ncbi:MAG: hypothetical protein RLZZ303_1411 [Candidatus Hydrogenedentota bacterium]|jgi:hypothetical protein